MEQNNKIQEAARQLAERSKNPAGAPTDGKKKGVLVVIDGKPPVGDNTTLMLYTVKLRAVDEQKPTVYFSLEESNQQVCNRLIAIITGIDQQKISDGTLTDDEWLLLDEKLPMLIDAPLYIDDTPALSLANLKKRLMNLANQNGVRLAVVDHLQELTDDGQPVNVHRIEADLKSISEELGITIIAVQD